MQFALTNVLNTVLSKRDKKNIYILLKALTDSLAQSPVSPKQRENIAVVQFRLIRCVGSPALALRRGAENLAK